MNRQHSRLFFLVIFWACGALASSGAGSGGDTMDRLLAAARQSLVWSYQYIRAGFDVKDLCNCKSANESKDFCPLLMGLTDAQRNLCGYFVFASASPVLSLNGTQNYTPFRLVYEPLTVPDPYGVPRPVQAMTPRGPTGEIEFNYQSTSKLWPAAIVELIGHEFGHKVEFGGQYLDDDSPVGAFNFPGGGRAFLDAVGSAVAVFAVKHAFVQQYQGVDDEYSCSINEYNSSGGSPRLYRSSGLKAYESGIGNFPRDFKCQMGEGGKSYLTLRLLVHDDNDCQDLSNESLRWTLLELSRIHTSERGEPVPPPEILKSTTYRGWSPVCDPNSSDKLQVEYKSVKFRLKYQGMAMKSLSQ
jgi:hypothetical protein